MMSKNRAINPLTYNAEGSRNYDDIINLDYPSNLIDTIKHPRMSTADRAKIFMPFAALKGYEQAVAEKGDSYVAQGEL